MIKEFLLFRILTNEKIMLALQKAENVFPQFMFILWIYTSKKESQFVRH